MLGNCLWLYLNIVIGFNKELSYYIILLFWDVLEVNKK